MSAPAIDVRAVRVQFGVVEALCRLDLSVPAGGSTALVGRNGAGKSTTMRVLAGLIPPSDGQAYVDGHDLRRDALLAKRASGYYPDVGGLVPRATPWEHLQLAPRLRRLEPGWEDGARELLEQFGLGAAAHRVTAGFSHGMGRRMSVVLAAFHRPRVLLLDEPFDGVDPFGAEATLGVITDARSRGAAVLVSTHLLELAVQACDEAVVLRGGLVVGAAPAHELGGEAGARTYRSMLA
ncbi:MAG: ABC transporter ATP-binding protein [Nocardioidaceae bacterium]